MFANFFGLAPRLRGLITDSALAASGPFSGGAQNPLNYPAKQIVLGNGLGFFSENRRSGSPTEARSMTGSASMFKTICRQPET